MTRLLIVYPELFRCASKFERKVRHLTANLNELTLIRVSDPHGFIQAYAEQDSRVSAVEDAADTVSAHATHAILFDDGEEFPDLPNTLAQSGVRVRRVKVRLTRVINIRREPGYEGRRSDATYEYIGRGAYWGNPYSMHEQGETREEVIRKFRYDFEHDKFLNIDVSRVHELAGKRLGCFCKPLPCHGDVLADFLNAWDDGE